MYLNGDNYDVLELLDKPTSTKLKSIVAKNKIVFVDEAQLIPQYWHYYKANDEESNGALCVYEFKWNPKAKAKFPKTFTSHYKLKKMQVVTPDYFEDFVGDI